MKKLLSLTLALALCFSLPVPALAANQAGDTTVTDAKGNTYTLSNPILYTISEEQLAQLPFTEDYVCYSVTGESHNPEESSLQSVTMAYAVPCGTTITPPAETTTIRPDGSIETRGFHLDPTAIEVRKSGDEYAIAYEAYFPMNPCVLNSSVNALWVIECFETKDSSGGGGGGSGSSFIGKIAFFTPISADLQNSFPGGTSSTDNPTSPTSPSNHVFSDVAANAYYYNAVKWAVEQGITNGTGDGSTFSPNDTCTQAQIITFLWRAAGSPVVNDTNPFSSVKETDYFYNAVVWAYANRIIDNSFSPHDPCTRANAVTYMYNNAGKPRVGNTGKFTDVATNASYANAVQWALDNGVTTGTGDGTTFSPGVICTRGQIATFLYRACE